MNIQAIKVKPVPRSKLPLDTSIAFLVRDLGRAIAKELRQRIEPYGISMPGWVVMRCIAENEGLSQRQLSLRLRVMETSSVEQLRKLEEQGLVLRSRSQEDQRRVEIRLSPKGRDLFEEMWPHAENVNSEILRFGTKEEARLLIKLLQKARIRFP